MVYLKYLRKFSFLFADLVVENFAVGIREETDDFFMTISAVFILEWTTGSNTIIISPPLSTEISSFFQYSNGNH